MSRKLVVWTAEIDNALRALRASEEILTFRQIRDRLAYAFDRPFTRNGCIGRAHRLGLPPHPLRPKRLEPVPHKPKKVKPMPVIAVDVPIAPVEAEPPPDKRELTILQLREGDCRWPSAEDRPPYTYCGAACEIGRSFCPEHYEIVYHPARRQP